jgi:hypothetical protein
MSAIPPEPTPELVAAVGRQFDDENVLIEQSLTDLFGQFPKNTELAHIYLKVFMLNKLYNTFVLAVVPMATNIKSHNIDADLAQGSPEIVDKIATLVSAEGKRRINYSFATKYCNWHKPAAYPIFDAHVAAYLWNLQKQKPFGPEFRKTDLRNYIKLKEIVSQFRDRYGFGSFNFKQIDKFLYVEGAKLIPPRPEAKGQDGLPKLMV